MDVGQSAEPYETLASTLSISSILYLLLFSIYISITL